MTPGRHKHIFWVVTALVGLSYGQFPDAEYCSIPCSRGQHTMCKYEVQIYVNCATDFTWGIGGGGGWFCCAPLENLVRWRHHLSVGILWLIHFQFQPIGPNCDNVKSLMSENGRMKILSLHNSFRNALASGELKTVPTSSNMKQLVHT